MSGIYCCFSSEKGFGGAAWLPMKDLTEGLSWVRATGIMPDGCEAQLVPSTLPDAYWLDRRLSRVLLTRCGPADGLLRAPVLYPWTPVKVGWMDWRVDDAEHVDLIGPRHATLVDATTWIHLQAAA